MRLAPHAIRDYFASYDGVILSGTMKLVDQQILPLAPGVVLAQGFVDFAFVLARRPADASHSCARLSWSCCDSRAGGSIRQHHFSPTPRCRRWESSEASG